jgi:hypothetical protein
MSLMVLVAIRAVDLKNLDTISNSDRSRYIFPHSDSRLHSPGTKHVVSSLNKPLSSPSWPASYVTVKFLLLSSVYLLTYVKEVFLHSNYRVHTIQALYLILSHLSHSQSPSPISLQSISVLTKVVNWTKGHIYLFCPNLLIPRTQRTSQFSDVSDITSTTCIEYSVYTII